LHQTIHFLSSIPLPQSNSIHFPHNKVRSEYCLIKLPEKLSRNRKEHTGINIQTIADGKNLLIHPQQQQNRKKERKKSIFIWILINIFFLLPIFHFSCMSKNYNVQKWSKISENNKFDSQQGNYHAVLISDKDSNCAVREFFSLMLMAIWFLVGYWKGWGLRMFLF